MNQMKLPNACDWSFASTHMLHPLCAVSWATENNMSGRERSREGVRSAENSEKIKRGEEAGSYDARLGVCKLLSCTWCLDDCYRSMIKGGV